MQILRGHVPGGNIELSVSTASRLSIWPVNACWHWLGSGSLAAQAGVLLPVSDECEIVPCPSEPDPPEPDPLVPDPPDPDPLDPSLQTLIRSYPIHLTLNPRSLTRSYPIHLTLTPPSLTRSYPIRQNPSLRNQIHWNQTQSSPRR